MSTNSDISTTFDTVLVANRGEIARRVFRSARDMGYRTVAVFVDADADAPFVTEADEAYRIPTYLDDDAVIGAATTAAADRVGVAVHPGYGFLAENTGFATAVADAGLVWVGPSPAAIAAMGDKIEAKKLAVSVDVPVLPSTEDESDFADIGFPLLVKAAAGGGGKGMRVVEAAADLNEAVRSAKREALSGFADERVFAERYVRRARHVEIQILGDANGTLVHLGERECSIQRRHQKIIEESPSPFVSDDLRSTMGDAAIRLAAEIGYRSAGTVEFLVDDESGEFFFLEINTRLQVEHPVTEEVTGIDLVREQLRIAAGEPLGYTQADVGFEGHAIEARLYAEDPSEDFLPATGRLDAFEPAAEPDVRWDAGVAAGSVIGVDFDPMIAKVIAHGPTRAEAAGRLALALERLHIGGLITNRDFLAATLRENAFRAGDTTTDFIERIEPTRSAELDEVALRDLAVAAALWLQGANADDAVVNRTIPSGFLIGRLPPEMIELERSGVTTAVHYRRQRDGGFILGADGQEGSAAVHDWNADGVDVEVDGRRRRYRVTKVQDRLHLTGGAVGVTFRLVPRFAAPELEIPGGAVAAPMPGRVLEVRVAVGDRVESGAVVAVLEAMKMENHLRSADAGTVTEVRVAEGDQVEKDVLLVIIEADEA